MPRLRSRLGSGFRRTKGDEKGWLGRCGDSARTEERNAASIGSSSYEVLGSQRLILH